MDRLRPDAPGAAKRHRKAQAEAKLAERLAELPEFIFTEADDRRTFERAFARVLGKAGLGAHFSPKSLRHSYASVMISEGANLLHVSRLLGHASVAVTEKHYTWWIPRAVPAVHQLDDSERVVAKNPVSVAAQRQLTARLCRRLGEPDV